MTQLRLCLHCVECGVFIPILIPYRPRSSLIQIAMETQTVKSLTPFSIEAILTRETPVGADPGKAESWEKSDNQCKYKRRASDAECGPRIGTTTSLAISPVHVSPSPLDMTLRRDMSVTNTRDDNHDKSRSRSPLSDRYNHNNDGSLPDAFSESSYSDDFDSDEENDCRDFADDVAEGTFLDLTCREAMTTGQHGDSNNKNLQCLSPRQNSSSTSPKGTF